MFIKNIYLEGFRSVQGVVDITPQKGINSIQGQNGYGKSSIIQAIQLLLFDKASGKLEELVNENSAGYYIAVELTHGGSDFRITMAYNHKSKKSDREIFINDFSKPAYNTVSDSVKFLNELFDPNLTYFAMTLMQDSFDILDAKDSERLEIFKKVRSLDYSKQAEQIKVLVKELEDKKLELEVEVRGLKERKFEPEELKPVPLTENEVESKNKEIEYIDNQLASIEQVSVMQAELVKAFEKEESSNEELVKRIEDTKLGITKCDNKLQNNAKDLEENKLKLENSLYTKESKLLALDNSIKSVPSEVENDVQGKVNILTNELEKLNISKNHHLKIISDFEGIEYTPYGDMIENIITLKNNIVNQIEMLSKIAGAKDNNNECFVCGSELGERKVNEAIEQIIVHEGMLKDTTAKLEEVKQEQQAFNEKNQVYNHSKTKLESLETIIADKEQQIESIKGSCVTEISKRVEQLEAQKVEVEQQFTERKKELESMTEFLKNNLLEVEEEKTKLRDDFKVLKGQLVESNKALETAKEKLNSIDLQDTTGLKAKKESLISLLDIHKNCIYHNEMIIDRNKKVKEEELENKKSIKVKEKDIEDTVGSIANNKEARNILLKHFPNFVIQETIGDVEKSMNDFISKTYDKDLNIALRSTATSLKLEYGITRKRDCRHLSGAEKILVSIAFIHSLNEQLGLNIMILDEPDAMLSSENTERLFEIIQSMDYNQLFMITHNKVMQEKLLVENARIYEFVAEGIIKEIN